jgi:hypothetical protein
VSARAFSIERTISQVIADALHVFSLMAGQRAASTGCRIQERSISSKRLSISSSSINSFRSAHSLASGTAAWKLA